MTAYASAAGTIDSFTSRYPTDLSNNWSPAGVPTSGDTATLNHAMYGRTAQTYGDGTTAVAMQINSAGSLLQKYDLTIVGNIVTAGPSGALIFTDDGTQPSTPLTVTLKNSATLRSRINSTAQAITSVMDFNSLGTRRMRVTADVSAGGVAGSVDPGNNGARWQTTKFGDCLFDGVGTTAGTQESIYVCGAIYVTGKLQFLNNCGFVYLRNNNQSTTNYDFSCGASNLTRDGATDTPNGAIIFHGALAGLTRVLRIENQNDKASGTETRCVNNAAVHIDYGTVMANAVEFRARDFRADNWYLHDAAVTQESGLGRRVIGTRWRHWTSSGSSTADAPVYSNINAGNVYDGAQWAQNHAPSGTQYHLNWETTGVDLGISENTYRNQYVDGGNWTGAEGNDFVLPGGAVRVEKNILFRGAGNSADGLTATASQIIEHNTYVQTIRANNGGLAAIVISESGAAATKLGAIRSNLFYQTSGITPGSAAGNWTRQQASAVIDYNAAYQPATYTTVMLRHPVTGVVTYATTPTGQVGTATAAAGSGPTLLTNPPAGTQRGDVIGVGSVYCWVTSVDGSGAHMDTVYNSAGTFGQPTLTTGTAVTVYQGYFADGRLYGETGFGANDKYVDPGFANAAFSFVSYDAANGGDGTLAGFFNRTFEAMTGYTTSGSTATPLSAFLYDPVSAGVVTALTPTAATLAAGGHDGNSIGAVQFSAGATLAAGTLALGTTTDVSQALSWTAATGGTAPYSYQPRISTNGGGSWSNWGAPTALTLGTLVGLTPATPYSYQVVVTDAAAGSATTNTVTQATNASSGGGGGTGGTSLITPIPGMDKDAPRITDTLRATLNTHIAERNYFDLNGVLSSTLATLPGCARASTASKVKTTNATVLKEAGAAVALAATDNYWTLTGADLPAGLVRRYLLLDTAGVASVLASNDRTISLHGTAALAAAACRWVRLPAQGTAIVGILTVIAGGVPFTPGTTLLSAAGISDSYVDGTDIAVPLARRITP